MFQRAIFIAISLLTLIAPRARAAYIPEDQPLPQSRSIYLRGLAGVAGYRRFAPSPVNTAVTFDWGGEIGFVFLQMNPNSEFSRLTLGLHFDTFTMEDEIFSGRLTSILGQILFVKSEDWGAYFGPEAGLRMAQLDSGVSASGIVVGFVAGVEIPLTTNLTYGPQFDFVYGLPLDLGLSDTETALIGRAQLALSYHF